LGNKLTYEDIIKYINSNNNGNGCKLITNEEDFYLEKNKQNKIASKTDLKIRCSCGEEFTTTFDIFKSKNKKQCNKCVGLYRFNYIDVKYFIEVESSSNCKLLSKDYINNNSLLLIQCGCGNIFKTSFAKFKDRNKRQCNDCGNKASGLAHKIPYHEIKNFIEVKSQSGCLLKTSENDYNNSHDDIIVQCFCGELFTTNFDRFSSPKIKHRQCKKCGEVIRRKNLSKPYDKIMQFINDPFTGNGCELLTNESEYTNSRGELEVRCNCGNIFKTAFHVFSRKRNPQKQCNNCGKLNLSNKLKIPYVDLVELFNNSNCILLTTEEEYLSTFSEKVKYKCSCGNISTISILKFKAGQRCRKCMDERKRNTNINNLGVPYPAQNKDVLRKQRKSLYQNGTMPCPRQQTYLYNLLGGEVNYSIKTINLDIAFPEEKLYIEFDGSGHDLQVKHGNKTQEQFDRDEKNRNYALYRAGFKEIRIISKSDKLPSDQVILEMISYAKDYLSTGHHYIKFNIDNSLVITSQFTQPYDYGKLRRIKKPDISIQEAI